MKRTSKKPQPNLAYSNGSLAHSKRTMNELIGFAVSVIIIFGAISITSGVAKKYVLGLVLHNQYDLTSLPINAGPLIYESSDIPQFLSGEDETTEPALHNEINYTYNALDPNSQHARMQRIGNHITSLYERVMRDDHWCLRASHNFDLSPARFSSIPIVFRRLII